MNDFLNIFCSEKKWNDYRIQMNKKLLLGAEAVAVAAIDAGISGVYAYPGTPSTEITTYIQNSAEAREKNIHSRWSANEKTAYEAALGMSYSGKRALICMKHVGLNVAADAFINSAITGCNGGMVLLVADDPSMHSSQNEQDTRMYGKFAYLPLLEPSNQQELYDAVKYAFDFSEKISLPIIVRVTTRLSHSRAVVVQSDKRPQNALNPSTQAQSWILLPANARKNYANLLAKQTQLLEESEQSFLNKSIQGSGEVGVIAFGIAYNYAMEIKTTHALDCGVLKISHYPLPLKTIEDFVKNYKTIVVAEEGYPIYEELLPAYFPHTTFVGRLTGALPRMGELNPKLLGESLGITLPVHHASSDIVVPRPPQLCQGCGHRDLFEELNHILEKYEHKHVFSDIGCYTLGALPPFNTISTCVDMGASITMAKGAADAGLHPAICVIGDSTFTHSGMTGLLDAVNDESNITIIISDNSTTAMTGGQDSSGTGKLYDICKGIGVLPEHIHLVVPIKKNREHNIRILSQEIEYKGVSVIISQRECVQVAIRNQKKS